MSRRQQGQGAERGGIQESYTTSSTTFSVQPQQEESMCFPEKYKQTLEIFIIKSQDDYLSNQVIATCAEAVQPLGRAIQASENNTCFFPFPGSVVIC